MRIVRVARPDGPAFGVVEAVEERAYVALLDGHPFGDLHVTERVAPLEDVRLLAPVIPTKILCVGRNYAEHAAEMRDEPTMADPPPSEPQIFAKLPTAVIGPGDAIRLPTLSAEVHHEAELAVVIGRLTRGCTVEQALDSVLGYTCANDVTARDLQRRDGQWTRAKGFDTFCPLGPWIDSDLRPADGLGVRCRVNGEPRQVGSTADMLFDVATLVASCAAFATLLPGDVLLTGTPAGVGPLRAGDTVEVEIDALGTLINPVEASGR